MQIYYRLDENGLIVYDRSTQKTIFCKVDGEYYVESSSDSIKGKPLYSKEDTRFKLGNLNEINLFDHLFSNIVSYNSINKSKSDTMLGKIRGLESKLRGELGLPKREAAEDKAR